MNYPIIKASIHIDSVCYPKIKGIVTCIGKFVSFNPEPIARNMMPFIPVLNCIVSFILDKFIFHTSNFSMLFDLVISFLVCKFIINMNCPDEGADEIMMLTCRITCIKDFIYAILFMPLFLPFTWISDPHPITFAWHVFGIVLFQIVIFILPYVLICIMDVPPQKREEKELFFAFQH